jgi:hypothetical protein
MTDALHQLPALFADELIISRFRTPARRGAGISALHTSIGIRVTMPPGGQHA